MPQKSVLANVSRASDGTSFGVWRDYTLRSAFQPIFMLYEGGVLAAACEGLTRAFRDDKPVSPVAFFGSLADEERVEVERLTRTLHLLNAGVCLPRNMAVFLNFDPSLFDREEAVAETASNMQIVLQHAGVDPHRIVCEVTEKKCASPEMLTASVARLREKGFRIAVDDFGSAQSDIERVKALRPDIVKFDSRWVSNAQEKDTDFNLLGAMVAIFAGQGMTTIVEGVEMQWQLDLARKAGASMAQGYLLARPEIAATTRASRKAAPALH